MSAISRTCRLSTRIANLQSALLDHTGHVYKGLGNDEVRMLVSEINAMRREIGWPDLDMSGRMRPRKYRRLPELDGWEYR